MMKVVLVLVVCCCIFGCVEPDNSTPANTSNGVGGSTARFVIQNDYLVVVEDRRIRTFSLKDSMKPKFVDESFTTGPRLETVFAYGKDLVLIGTNQGAVITRITNEGLVDGISFASHFTSRDPVIAENDIMYVTIRPEENQARVVDDSGVLATDPSNRLIVYDISNLGDPEEITQLGIKNPTGLSLSGNRLYVCFAEGLRIYDITEPRIPKAITDYADFPCNDVIAAENSLIATGEKGIELLENQKDVISLLASIKPGD